MRHKPMSRPVRPKPMDAKHEPPTDKVRRYKWRRRSRYRHPVLQLRPEQLAHAHNGPRCPPIQRPSERWLHDAYRRS